MTWTAGSVDAEHARIIVLRSPTLAAQLAAPRTARYVAEPDVWHSNRPWVAVVAVLVAVEVTVDVAVEVADSVTVDVTVDVPVDVAVVISHANVPASNSSSAKLTTPIKSLHSATSPVLEIELLEWHDAADGPMDEPSCVNSDTSILSAAA